MRLVMIDWADSGSCHGSHWRDPGEINPNELECKSVGWVLHDSEKVITIVPHLSFGNADGSLGQVKGDITIPKGCIRRVHELGEQFTISLESGLEKE